MRTTIILDNVLEKKIRQLVPERKLSQFINQCIQFRLDYEDQHQRAQRLDKEYEQAAQLEDIGAEFEAIDTEGWPEW